MYNYTCRLSEVSSWRQISRSSIWTDIAVLEARYNTYQYKVNTHQSTLLIITLHKHDKYKKDSNNLNTINRHYGRIRSLILQRKTQSYMDYSIEINLNKLS